MVSETSRFDSPEPVYLQVYEQLQAQICAGVYSVHERLPSEPELAHTLGVARGTLRKAVDALVAEGLVRRVHGRGTFVAPPPINSGMGTSLSSIAEELDRQGVTFTTDVLLQRIVAPGEAPGAAPLGVDGDGKVLELRRVRSDEAGPIAYFENYVRVDSPSDADSFMAADFTTQTLFSALEEITGTEISWGQRVMSADAASGNCAALLGVAPGSPLLTIGQTSHTVDGKVIECSDIWIVPNRMRISAVVPRGL